MATLSLTCGSGDCYFFPPSGDIWTGLTNIDFGKSGTAAKNCWLPFASVGLEKGTSISSAILKLVCASSGSSTTVKVKIGNEAADNPSDPTTIASAASRVLSTAYTTDNNVAAWTAGTEYTFDITTAVQEILNRGGWNYGNKLALMIVDNGSSDAASRSFAASEHASYAEAKLDIVYTLPSSGNLFWWS